MGIFKSAEKILAVAVNHSSAFIWSANSVYKRNCHCAFHLYDLLERNV